MCGTPLISIVIPFFSKEKGRLQKAVDSALGQTRSDVEVIVVDDCSPISAQDEIGYIVDKRLRIIRHESNKNGALARNSGVAVARGKFVAFLDYDDIWHPHKLERQLRLFLEVDYPKAVIYTQCIVVDNRKKYIRPERSISNDEKVGDYLFVSKQIIQTSGIFLLATVAKEVAFDNLTRHQDYQFCLSLEAAGCKFYMVHEPLYCFVQIPKVNCADYAIQWLAKYQHFLSFEAVKGFKSLVVMRSMASAGDFRRLICYSAKEGSLWDGVKAIVARLMKNLLPGAVHILKKR